MFCMEFLRRFYVGGSTHEQVLVVLRVIEFNDIEGKEDGRRVTSV